MRSIFVLIIIFFSCSNKNVHVFRQQESTYDTAFLCLLDAKKGFDTPYIKGDSIRVLDRYYVDTFSLYYYQMNASFEMTYIDTTLYPKLKGGVEGWKYFQQVSEFVDDEGYHNSDLIKKEYPNVKLVSEADAKVVKSKHNILYYSPLLPVSNDRFIIYEQIMNPRSYIYYKYRFKRIGNEFVFISRSYLDDVMNSREDYMKTINFNQTYEEFTSRK